MKRTSATWLVVFTVIGGAAGALLEAALATSGRPIIIPPITLPLAVAVIGGLVVSLAVPIFRFTRGQSKDSIDPFYATRVLGLAKASSLIGGLVLGFGVGITGYVLTRSVVPVGSVGMGVATIVGAGILLAGGLIAENMCTIPPRDDDHDDKGPTVKVRP